MYNKLFTKILDSTIWLEPDSTRLVWITFLAVMDEDGFVALSSVGNVAARARVSLEDAEKAVRALESPDSIDSSQEHEGRRIERVPYGWMVLNAAKYRDLIRRETAKEQTRVRVARHREKLRNAGVTQPNEKITPSVAVAVAVTETVKSKEEAPQRSRGSRLQPDWEPDPALKAWAEKERPDLDLGAVIDGFRDFWIAKPGKDGTKLDWPATFRNWVRNQRSAKPGLPQAGSAPRPTIQCRSCGNRVSTWTGHQCDPCWRKSQGMDNPLAGLQ